jgi:NADH-quinone oxidoreductase subunit J
MLFQDIIFWLLAIVGVGAALGVVFLKDIFRSALLLVLVFATISAHFFMLGAEFLGVVQLLIYAGAISILIIFAIMLTRNVQSGNLPNRIQGPAFLIAALVLATLIFVFADTDWRLIEALPNGDAIADQTFVNTPFKLSKLMLENYAVAFGAAAVLLLGSIIGALSLVREEE